jgi:SAM-dependent methyltransferase
MTIVFATIATHDFLDYAAALQRSLRVSGHDVRLHVLITDTDDGVGVRNDALSLRTLEDLGHHGVAGRIGNRFPNRRADELRWSMKPVFAKYLLGQGADQVFLLDPDLFFYSDAGFLSDELENASVLLSPHWRPSNPRDNEAEFVNLTTRGHFNGGFVGVARSGIPAMEWWAEACAYRCAKEPERGFYDDQGYLDLLPVLFDGVRILRHRGCNLARWNQTECRRELAADGRVLINGRDEVVFIHFTKSTIEGIEGGEDSLLAPHLERYRDALAEVSADVPTESACQAAETGLTKQPQSRKIPDPAIPSALGAFVEPQLGPTTLDRFWIRRSIVRHLRRAAPELHGQLLDVGCGYMPYRELLISESGRISEYLGLDLVDNPIHDNAPDLTWDGRRIPLEDASVDGALCTEVLEHCPDPPSVLSEIHRVLRPNGVLVFTVPFVWPLHEAPNDFARYTPWGLAKLLTDAGFTDLDLRPLGGWEASLAQMIGLWVRRRPMNRWLRAALSLAAWPVVAALLAKDRPPTSFADNTMVTGLGGRARRSDRSTMGV